MLVKIQQSVFRCCFFIVPRKQGLAFHVITNCLKKCLILFSGHNKKNINNLLLTLLRDGIRLTLSTLQVKISAANILKYFFLFFPENWFLTFHANCLLLYEMSKRFLGKIRKISIDDTLHEMSKPVLWEKLENIISLSPAKISPER